MEQHRQLHCPGRSRVQLETLEAARCNRGTIPQLLQPDPQADRRLHGKLYREDDKRTVVAQFQRTLTGAGSAEVTTAKLILEDDVGDLELYIVVSLLVMERARKSGSGLKSAGNNLLYNVAPDALVAAAVVVLGII